MLHAARRPFLPGLISVLLLFSLDWNQPAFAQAPATVPSPAFPYQPITDKERVKWAVKSTIGPQSLAAGVVSAGWGTAFNNPEEYGPTWSGFAKRYGMRLTGVSTGNAIEASVGKLWREDPRYFESPNRNFWQRVGHAADMTFRARGPEGNLRPSYARFTGNVGNNFLSNLWRVDSESNVEAALIRSGVGVAGKFGSNLFEEFWPSVWRKIKGS